MVIPVHDVNPLRRTPWVTWSLIAANVVVFLLTPTAPATLTSSSDVAQTCRQQAFFDRWAAIPGELMHNHQLATVATGRVFVGPQGQLACLGGPPSYDKSPLLSVFVSMFLHGSWLHLLGNMLFLFIFGNNVEDRFGRVRFLLFYLASGVVATYGFALANPNSPEVLIGASGAIAGVLGAYIVLWPRVRVWSLVWFIPLPLPAWLVLGLWFLLQWAYTAGFATAAGSVAYLAHVYGFAFGAIVGLLVRSNSPNRRAPPPYGYSYRR